MSLLFFSSAIYKGQLSRTLSKPISHLPVVLSDWLSQKSSPVLPVPGNIFEVETLTNKNKLGGGDSTPSFEKANITQFGGLQDVSRRPQAPQTFYFQFSLFPRKFQKKNRPITFSDKFVWTFCHTVIQSLDIILKIGFCIIHMIMYIKVLVFSYKMSGKPALYHFLFSKYGFLTKGHFFALMTSLTSANY